MHKKTQMKSASKNKKHLGAILGPKYGPLNTALEAMLGRIQGYGPHLGPRTSASVFSNWEFPLKISIKTVSYIPSYDSIKRYVCGFLFLRMIALSRRENIMSILIEYIVTKIMRKVSFNISEDDRRIEHVKRLVLLTVVGAPHRSGRGHRRGRGHDRRGRGHRHGHGGRRHRRGRHTQLDLHIRGLPRGKE